VSTTLKNPEEIRQLLAHACGRKELLILATPYLRFESSFVALQDNELHALATMSREDAVVGLATGDLKIRFPRELGFLEAQVQLLGLGLVDGRRTLRLSLPKSLHENDQRVAYRVERLGRVEVTFSTPKPDIFTATLLDLSISGARLHAHKDLPEGALHPGDAILISIPLNDQIRIQTTALVCHMAGRNLGIQYRTELGPEIREPLSHWVFLKREEERDRLARRMELAVRPDSRANGVPELSILLISTDSELEQSLKAALEGVRPVSRVVPATQPLKEALLSKPSLAIFHVQDGGLDERRRLKTLMELVKHRLPTLLLGTGLDGATLFELAGEWKASSSISWHSERGDFLERLVRGMIRRHMNTGDGPLTPQDHRVIAAE